MRHAPSGPRNSLTCLKPSSVPKNYAAVAAGRHELRPIWKSSHSRNRLTRTRIGIDGLGKQYLGGRCVPGGQLAIADSEERDLAIRR